MMKFKKLFFQKIGSRKALGTLEVVIIIAILLILALLFKKYIISFATKLFDHVFNQSVIDNLS